MQGPAGLGAPAVVVPLALALTRARSPRHQRPSSGHGSRSARKPRRPHGGHCEGLAPRAGPAGPGVGAADAGRPDRSRPRLGRRRGGKSHSIPHAAGIARRRRALSGLWSSRDDCRPTRECRLAQGGLGRRRRPPPPRAGPRRASPRPSASVRAGAGGPFGGWSRAGTARGAGGVASTRGTEVSAARESCDLGFKVAAALPGVDRPFQRLIRPLPARAEAVGTDAAVRPGVPSWRRCRTAIGSPGSESGRSRPWASSAARFRRRSCRSWGRPASRSRTRPFRRRSCRPAPRPTKRWPRASGQGSPFRFRRPGDERGVPTQRKRTAESATPGTGRGLRAGGCVPEPWTGAAGSGASERPAIDLAPGPGDAGGTDPGPQYSLPTRLPASPSPGS